MGVQNFIPELWSAAVQVPLRKALVFVPLCTREFEGNLVYGSKLRINQIGPVTVNTYTRDASITWQDPDTAQIEILVDQQQYFAVKIDDLNNVQTNPKLLAKFGEDAAYQVADDMDGFIAGLYTDAGLSVDAATVSAGNVLVNLSNFQLEMDEGNVPTQGRVFVARPWYMQDLVQAATGVIGHTGVPKVFNGSPLAMGYIGELNGFTLFKSNNVTNTQPMAFTTDAIAFVSQLQKVKYVDNPTDYFFEGIKGLYLYGGKVVRPDKLCTCTTTQG